jgi:hypothetical protein
VYLNMIRRAQPCSDAAGDQFQHHLWWWIIPLRFYIYFCIILCLRDATDPCWLHNSKACVLTAVCYGEESTPLHVPCHLADMRPVALNIGLLAQMPGVAPHSIRNVGTREIMALHKNNCNFQRVSPPEIEPPLLEKRHILPLPEIQPRLSSP